MLPDHLLFANKYYLTDVAVDMKVFFHSNNAYSFVSALYRSYALVTTCADRGKYSEKMCVDFDDGGSWIRLIYEATYESHWHNKSCYQSPPWKELHQGIHCRCSSESNQGDKIAPWTVKSGKKNGVKSCKFLAKRCHVLPFPLWDGRKWRIFLQFVESRNTAKEKEASHHRLRSMTEQKTYQIILLTVNASIDVVKCLFAKRSTTGVANETFGMVNLLHGFASLASSNNCFATCHTITCKINECYSKLNQKCKSVSHTEIFFLFFFIKLFFYVPCQHFQLLFCFTRTSHFGQSDIVW